MYLISPITVLDDDKGLFETHVGLDNKEMTLLISVWAETAEASRQKATEIVEMFIVAERNTLQELSPDCRTYPLTHNDMIQPHEPIKRH